MTILSRRKPTIPDEDEVVAQFTTGLGDGWRLEPVTEEVSKSYCAHCRARQSIENPRRLIERHGVEAIIGRCAGCGQPLSRLSELPERLRSIRR